MASNNIGMKRSFSLRSLNCAVLAVEDDPSDGDGENSDNGDGEKVDEVSKSPKTYRPQDIQVMIQNLIAWPKEEMAADHDNFVDKNDHNNFVKKN